jgi:hypothetical protein
MWVKLKTLLYTATLIPTKSVIPAKAGIQASSLRKQGTSMLRTGFPRIKYGAGLVKPGMTNCWNLLSNKKRVLPTIPLFQFFSFDIS